MVDCLCILRWILNPQFQTNFEIYSIRPHVQAPHTNHWCPSHPHFRLPRSPWWSQAQHRDNCLMPLNSVCVCVCVLHEWREHSYKGHMLPSVGSSLEGTAPNDVQLGIFGQILMRLSPFLSLLLCKYWLYLSNNLKVESNLAEQTLLRHFSAS